MEGYNLEVLRQILEHSKFAITLVNEQGNLTLFNKAAERLTGYDREEVLNQPISMFYKSEEDIREMLEVVFRDGKLEDFETTLISKDGSSIPISIFISLLHDPTGKPVGSLGITMDLRERKRMESDLGQAKQLADFYTDLLCHDIRNYDQTILGYLDMLIEGLVGDLSGEQQRILQICRRQAGRMSDLIDRVQTLSNLNHDIVTALEPVEIEPLIEKIIETIQEAYQEKKVELDIHLSGNVRVMACPLVNDLLFNLLSNSVAHNNSAKPMSWLSVKPGDLEGRPSWKIVIEDNGPGIRDKYKEVVFERFTRFNPHGTGIGLSLVKALVDRYGGRVWVEDRISGKPEQGVRFITELRAVV